FVGRDALVREKERGPQWALVGLEIDWVELEALYDEYGLPPHLGATAWRTAVPVYDEKGQVGRATSGTWSPILKKNLAMASVEAAHSAVGASLRIEHTVEYHRRTLTARVVERPFFNPERKRS